MAAYVIVLKMKLVIGLEKFSDSRCIERCFRQANHGYNVFDAPPVCVALAPASCISRTQLEEHFRGEKD
ncbi:hypothetical protein quinque_009439 [Culex quinquefasciatus]